MNRRVSREKGLDSFSIDIDILSHLLDKLLELFNEKENLKTSIEFELKEEYLNFDNVEEIRQYAEQNKSFPKIINKYSLEVYGHSPFEDGGLSFVYIRPNFIGNRVYVRATSNSDAWCAGAIDSVTSFLRPHRVWYYFLYRIKIWWVVSIGFLSLLMFGFLDSLKLLESGTGKIIGTITAYLLLLSLITSIVLFVLKNIIPPSEIKISKQEGFIRLRYREILIFIAVVGFLFEFVRFVASITKSF